MLGTTVGGGFAVPIRTWYEVAPDDAQLRFGTVVTLTAPFGGFGDVGAEGPAGGGGATAPTVVNDQTGPTVLPPLLLATICQ